MITHTKTSGTVLHVVPYMHPRAGGPPVVVDRVCRRLEERGIATRVVSTNAFVPHGDVAWTEQLTGRYPLDVLPGGGPGQFSYSRPLSRALNQLIPSAQLVHLHTLWTHATWSAMRICRRHRVPYVVMPHGMLDPNSLRRGWFKKRVYGTLFEWPNLRRARAMIYTHANERSLAESSVAGLPPGYVVPLGCDEPPEAPRHVLADEFLSSHPQLRNKPLVMFLSRLHPKKGVDILIRAFGLLANRGPTSHLVLVGPADPEYARQLRQIVGECQLSDRVTFTGSLGGREKWAALAAASVFALPSHQENFGLAIVEAMRLGVPVVISRNVNIWPEIESSGGGVIAETTPQAVANSLEPLLRSQDVRDAMGLRGQQFVWTQYTWDRAADALSDAYRQILTRAHVPQCLEIASP